MIKNRFPDIQIVGNKKTFGMIDGFFGMEYNKLEVKEGDSLTLGKHTLQFYTAPIQIYLNKYSNFLAYIVCTNVTVDVISLSFAPLADLTCASAIFLCLLIFLISIL